jgi:hypothetical protein
MKNDVFDVNVLNKEYQYQSLDYIIYGKDNKMIRKGHFRAPSVQLRITPMQECEYLFQIVLSENEKVNIPFHKTHSLAEA